MSKSASVQRRAPAAVLAIAKSTGAAEGEVGMDDDSPSAPAPAASRAAAVKRMGGDRIAGLPAAAAPVAPRASGDMSIIGASASSISADAAATAAAAERGTFVAENIMLSLPAAGWLTVRAQGRVG
jgi:hypothetical protein